MKILQTVTKVPGGLMVVPMFIGVLVNTFAPEALKIGGFTEALTNKGYLTLVAMYLFVVGTKMTLRAAPVMLKRGFRNYVRQGWYCNHFVDGRGLFFRR